MKVGYRLTFFTLQSRRHNGMKIADWLEKIAKEVGIQGVTIVNASSGIGHDGTWHSISFFELADQPLEIIMIADEDACTKLFDCLHVESPKLFYTKAAIEYGTV
jgi:PII-like signaling protein